MVLSIFARSLVKDAAINSVVRGSSVAAPLATFWASHFSSLSQHAISATAKASAEHSVVRSKTSNVPFQDADIAKLMENNKAWKAEVEKDDPEFFTEKIGKGQSPKFLYIGCADSRVAAETMLGLKPGELFVHRNVANLVISTDMSALTAIQYSVEVLRVQNILVCGHYDCGGVRAASKQTENFGGVIEGWLQNVRDVIRQHADELNAIDDPEERHRRTVELNVIEQCRHIVKNPVVQRERMRTHALLKGSQHESKAYASAKLDAEHRGIPNIDETPTDYPTPRVHPLVFDPATGEVKLLDMSWRQEYRDLSKIYNLYSEYDVDDHVKMM